MLVCQINVGMCVWGVSVGWHYWNSMFDKDIITSHCSYKPLFAQYFSARLSTTKITKIFPELKKRDKPDKTVFGPAISQTLPMYFKCYFLKVSAQYSAYGAFISTFCNKEFQPEYICTVSSHHHGLGTCVRQYQTETKAITGEKYKSDTTFHLDCLKSLIVSGVTTVSRESKNFCVTVFSDAPASLALMIVTDSLTHRNWRLAILHVWQFLHHPSRNLSVWSVWSVWSVVVCLVILRNLQFFFKKISFL